MRTGREGGWLVLHLAVPGAHPAALADGDLAAVAALGGGTSWPGRANPGLRIC
jgi:hypothetical protein